MRIFFFSSENLFVFSVFLLLLTFQFFLTFRILHALCAYDFVSASVFRFLFIVNLCHYSHTLKAFINIILSIFHLCMFEWSNNHSLIICFYLLSILRCSFILYKVSIFFSQIWFVCMDCFLYSHNNNLPDLLCFSSY